MAPKPPSVNGLIPINESAAVLVFSVKIPSPLRFDQTVIVKQNRQFQIWYGYCFNYGELMIYLFWSWFDDKNKKHVSGLTSGPAVTNGGEPAPK